MKPSSLISWRAHVHQWLMFQMASVGLMFGQAAHFNFYAKDKHPYAIERYSNEMVRLLRVMDEHLADREWFAGSEYSIADMAVLPWVTRAVDNPALPARNNLSVWAKRMKARPRANERLQPVHP
jgi:GST-like protein